MIIHLAVIFCSKKWLDGLANLDQTIEEEERGHITEYFTDPDDAAATPRHPHAVDSWAKVLTDALDCKQKILMESLSQLNEQQTRQSELDMQSTLKQQQLDHEKKLQDDRQLHEQETLKLTLEKQRLELETERKLADLKLTHAQANPDHLFHTGDGGSDGGSQKGSNPTPTVPLPQLPPVTLSKFNGRTDRQSFWKVFEDVVHSRTDIPDSTKYRYLCECLTKEAANVLKHISARGNYYEAAITTLKKEFDDPSRLIHQHLSTLLTITPRSESLSDQLDMVRTLETVLAQLSSLGVPVNDQAHALSIANRLSGEAKRFMLTKLTDESDLDIPVALDQLHSRLKKEVLLQQLSLPAKGKSTAPVNAIFDDDYETSSQSQTKKKHDKKVVGTSASFTANVRSSKHPVQVNEIAQLCFYCEKHTNHVRCYKYDANQKRERATKQKRCLKCLDQGYKASQCSQPDCHICGRPHHFSLCFEFFSKKFDPKGDQNKRSQSEPVQVMTEESDDQESNDSSEDESHNTVQASVSPQTPVDAMQSSGGMRMLTTRVQLVSPDGEHS